MRPDPSRDGGFDAQRPLMAMRHTAGVDVLVVDDEPALRDALERAFRAEGFGVRSAVDGQDALEIVADAPPDLIVLDVLMPRLDGLETCRRLRETGDRTPVLMLTARDAVRDRVAGLDAGADDYLVKPFALEELLARTRALLRRAAPDADERPLTFADLRLDRRAGTFAVPSGRSNSRGRSSRCSSCSSATRGGC
jgi:two-component system response regulator MprA